MLYHRLSIYSCFRVVQPSTQVLIPQLFCCWNLKLWLLSLTKNPQVDLLAITLTYLSDTYVHPGRKHSTTHFQTFFQHFPSIFQPQTSALELLTLSLSCCSFTDCWKGLLMLKKAATQAAGLREPRRRTNHWSFALFLGVRFFLFFVRCFFSWGGRFSRFWGGLILFLGCQSSGSLVCTCWF